MVNFPPGATGFARAGGVETAMPPLMGTTCRLGMRKSVHTGQGQHDCQGLHHTRRKVLKSSVFNALGLVCRVEITLALAKPVAPNAVHFPYVFRGVTVDR